MWSGNLKGAIASLRASRGRTTFTMLGIIIGIISVVTIVSLGEGLKRQVSGQINQLGSNVLTVRPGKSLPKQGGLSGLNLYSFLAPSTITQQDVQSLSSISSVSNVVPVDYVTSSAQGDDGEVDNLFVAGTSDNFADVLRQNIVYGATFPSDDSQDNVAIIGSDVATKLFSVYNPVGENIKIDGQDFLVHGVLAPSGGSLLSISGADLNSSVFIPMSSAEDLAAGHTNVLQVFVQLKPGSNLNNAVNQIQNTISKNHGGANDFSVLKQNQLLNVSGQVINTVTSTLSAIAAIALVVGGIGVMNIMLVSVSERTREIGIRKAIGATNRQIMEQFLVEGLALSIGAGIIGILISLLINLLLRLYSGWKPVISVPILIIAVVVAVAAGIVFSIAPALKAARKHPIEALRGE